MKRSIRIWSFTFNNKILHRFYALHVFLTSFSIIHFQLTGRRGRRPLRFCAAFRISHFAFRISHFAFRIDGTSKAPSPTVLCHVPHFAFRISHFAFRIDGTSRRRPLRFAPRPSFRTSHWRDVEGAVPYGLCRVPHFAFRIGGTSRAPSPTDLLSIFITNPRAVTINLIIYCEFAQKHFY